MNLEYIRILTSEKSPLEKSEDLFIQIHKDQKSAGFCIEMRRSLMAENLIRLLNEDIIGMEDMTEFSQSLQNLLKKMSGRHGIE